MCEVAGNNYKRKDVFHLADLECLSSNFINALMIRKKDYRHFLLNYWNVEYYNNILFGAKNINFCFPDYLYGIKLTGKEGPLSEITELLNQGVLIFLEANASDLHFFPGNWLRFEDNSLKHTCLLLSYDNQKKEFHVLDAILRYKGISSYTQIEQTRNEKGLYSFTVIEENQDHVSPPIRAILFKATDYNHRLYIQRLFPFGHRAFQLFRQGLNESIKMNKPERHHWAWSNVKSVNSIISIHRQIWKIFVEYMKKEYISEETGNKFQHLLVNWETLLNNLRLFRDNGEAGSAVTDSLSDCSRQIAVEEEELLCSMREAVIQKYHLVKI